MKYEIPRLSHKIRRKLKQEAMRSPDPIPRIKPGSIGWKQGPIKPPKIK